MITGMNSTQWAPETPSHRRHDEAGGVADRFLDELAGIAKLVNGLWTRHTLARVGRFILFALVILAVMFSYSYAVDPDGFHAATRGEHPTHTSTVMERRAVAH